MRTQSGGLAVRLSDRHFGTEAPDGLILIRPSDQADAMMDLYNADGSGYDVRKRYSLCGKYLYEKDIVKRMPAG